MLDVISIHPRLVLSPRRHRHHRHRQKKVANDRVHQIGEERRSPPGAPSVGPNGAFFMKRAIALVVFAVVIANSPVLAQVESVTNASTTVPESARFEVVQSPLLAKLAFRLDRFTGDTWQFVSKKDGGYAWQKIKRITIPNDVRTPGKINYQVFLSGIRAQVTILMNTNTGVSWYIAEDPEEGIFWSPMR